MTAFLENLNDRERSRLVDYITKAIDENFLFDKARATQAEIKHRFQLCVGLASTMRNDLGWSWQRIGDNLGHALRSKLDSGDWNPNSRSTWSTDPGSGLILPPGTK